MLLSVKEIINRSLDVYKRDIRVWVPYVILTFIFSFLSLIFTSGTLFSAFILDSGFSLVLAFCLSTVAVLILVVMSMWVNIGLTQVVQKRIDNQDSKHFKEEMAEGKHLLGRSIGVSFVVGLIIGLPLILSAVGFSLVGFLQMTRGFSSASNFYLFFVFLAIYGLFHLIYFSIKFSLSYYAVVLDGKSVHESLSISNHLVKGRVFTVFSKLFVPIFLFVFVYFLIDYIFNATALWVGGNIALWTANILSLVVSVFMSPLTILSTVLLYENLKANPVVLEIENKK